MKTLYESLLDDEEELIDSIDLNNIFEQISSAKSLKEFTKYFDRLLNLCTKCVVSELTPEQRLELDKDKKSLYICKSREWNNRLVIYINRIFKYTSKSSVKISPIEYPYGDGRFYVVCQTQKVKPSPFYKQAGRNCIIPESNTIYKIPASLMKAFKEWYENHGDKFLQSYQSI